LPFKTRFPEASVNSLRLKLGRGRRRYEDQRRRLRFLPSRARFEMLPAVTGIDRSLGPFEQAIANDSSFAPAYAGLAAAHAARSGFDDPVDWAGELFKGWAAAQKAIQLDPLMAEPHDALGMMHAREAQWNRRNAGSSAPSSSPLATRLWHCHFAQYLSCRSAGSMRRYASCAWRRNSIRFHPQCTFFCAGPSCRLAGLIRQKPIAGKRRQTSNKKSGCLADALLRQGKTAEGVQMLEARWSGNLLEPGGRFTWGCLCEDRPPRGRGASRGHCARPLAKSGHLRRFGRQGPHVRSSGRVVPLGPVRMGRDVLIDPRFALLRGDPRLNALRRKSACRNSRFAKDNTRKMSSPSERLPHHRLAMRRLGRRRVYSWGACEAPPGNSRRPGGNWPGSYLVGWCRATARVPTTVRRRRAAAAREPARAGPINGAGPWFAPTVR